MCFIKSGSPSLPVQEEVIRHEANASLTKNSSNNQEVKGYKQNIKTSALGLDEQAKTAKKTLLGE